MCFVLHWAAVYFLQPNCYVLPALLPSSIIELKVVATAGLTHGDGKDDDDDGGNAEQIAECRSLLTLANVSTKPGVRLD